MKKIVRLTENDLVRIVKKIISEETTKYSPPSKSVIDEITKFGKINLNDVISKFTSQEQGFSGDFYWFRGSDKTGYGSSEMIFLYRLISGYLMDFCVLAYNTPKKEWWIRDKPSSYNNPQFQAADVLNNLIGNVNRTYSTPGEPKKINNTTYIEYINNFVTTNPKSDVAFALRTPSDQIKPSNSVASTDIAKIKTNPIYTSLAKPSTPSTTQR